MIWDSDVADAVESLGDELIEILCVSQGTHRRRGAWITRTVREIWRAIDEAGDPSVVFVCDHGEEISGLLAERSIGHTKTKLIAKITGPKRLDPTLQ